MAEGIVSEVEVMAEVLTKLWWRLEKEQKCGAGTYPVSCVCPGAVKEKDSGQEARG